MKIILMDYYYSGRRVESTQQSLNLVQDYILVFVLVLTSKDSVTIVEVGHQLILVTVPCTGIPIQL